MERAISVTRSCESSYEAVAEILRQDPTQALRSAGTDSRAKDSRAIVHLQPRRPWRPTDVEVSPTIGRLEKVDGSTARLNLSWRAPTSNHVPDATGHLEIRALSSTTCEFHYAGTYERRGVLRRTRELLTGGHLPSDAANQMLDRIVNNIQAHLTAPL